ncbi:MAG: TIGR01906 family membrane protein [Anaerolineae bacterium]|nr:TIGR01906 family membrane protein [Anaerolineae bacterium]
MKQHWPKLLHILIVIALPLALFAATLRIVTGHWLVNWEYGKASFPPDTYGFSTEERIRLAEVSVDYLITDAGIELLADLETEGGAAFNARELEHMVDVKRVLWILLRVGAAAGLVVVAGTAVLGSRPATRARAPVALMGGSFILLGLLAAIGGLMLASWNVFFVQFHELFFPPGTWTFAYSDTLIRLFPVRFWMDVAAVIVGVLVAQAAAIGGAAFVWWRR